MEGKRKGDFLVVTPRGISVGRLSTNDLYLPDDQVSRQHAKLEPRDGGYYIVDLGSSNGTKLNGVAVADSSWSPETS